MRAGRLPEDHPLEQMARAKLRAKSPQAAAKAEQTVPVVEPYVPEPVVAPREPRRSYQPPPQPRPRPQPKRRWG